MMVLELALGLFDQDLPELAVGFFFRSSFLMVIGIGLGLLVALVRKITPDVRPQEKFSSFGSG
jgi:hypothetical protein